MSDMFSRKQESIFKNPSGRLMTKSGSLNVHSANIEKKRLHFIYDGFTTVLELKWRWILFMFMATFIFSWFFFTLLWFALITWHGDFDHVHDNDWTPCVWNIRNFLSVLLFSIETQSTIGYGYRYISEKCEVGVFLLVLQSVLGAMLQALLAGTLLAKLQIPKHRRKTISFSRKACICLQNTDMCLLFRVGNIRRSEIVNAHARALFIKHRYTSEGDMLPNYVQELKVGLDSGARMHLWWPTTLIHIIEEDSPFWYMSPRALVESKFELILILEGSVASTSLSFQGRTSYLPDEIEWGYRFQPMFKSRSPVSKYEVDFQYFHEICRAPLTPRMSAKQWKSHQTRRHQRRQPLFSITD